MTSPQTQFRDGLMEVLADIDDLIGPSEVDRGVRQTLHRSTVDVADGEFGSFVWIGAVTVTYAHHAMRGPDGPSENVFLRAEINVDVSGPDLTTDEATDQSDDLAQQVRAVIRTQIGAGRQWLEGQPRAYVCQVVEVDTREAAPLKGGGAACLSTVTALLGPPTNRSTQ